MDCSDHNKRANRSNQEAGEHRRISAASSRRFENRRSVVIQQDDLSECEGTKERRLRKL